MVSIPVQFRYHTGNVGNGGGVRIVEGGQIEVVVPARGFVVFRRRG
jgi:hypothetical protein